MFIADNSKEYDIKLLCRCLNVSRSLYYYHINNPLNSYEKSNMELDKRILDIYDESLGVYGSPKIAAILNKEGILVSQKRVAKRMKSLGIRSIVVKKYKPASTPNADNSKRVNILNQDFTSDKPGEKLVGDITYVYTIEKGWTYLAIVLDLFDHSVVGYAYDSKMETKLVIKALNETIRRRHIEKDAIFHSDQGSQYISNDFENLLKMLKIRHSYSKKGYPYDNASMESFNSLIKKERLNHIVFKTFEEAKLTIFDYIEGFYNTRRIHGTLGYISPKEKMDNYLNSLNNS